MRAPHVTGLIVLPAALLLGGCGYVHIGRLPEPTTTIMGDEKLMQENTDLRAEKKILQRELALTRAQGDQLRMAIENRAADGDTSRRLTDKLAETSRELAQLRASYATLQGERTASGANATNVMLLQGQLGATEQKLAAALRDSTQLQEEIGRLKSEVQQARTENVTLTEQVRTVTAQNVQAQAALAQLNTDLLAQKDARVRAEQDAETLRTQLTAGANASTLAQQKTGAAAEARTLAAEQATEIISLKKDLDALRAKVDVLEGERTQLKQQLAANPAADLATLEAKLAGAQRDNSELRAAKSDLETQLAQLKSSPAGAEAATLRTQLRDAQSAATALTAENERLRSRLTNTRVIPADQVTRINLDAPAPLADNTERAAPSATNTGITRSGSGVQAALMTTVPGSPRSSARTEVTPPPAGAGRVHVVTGGDTLSKISIMYYGTPARWADILAANRDILGENNNLVIGRTLRIP